MHHWIHSTYLVVVTLATLFTLFLTGRRAWELRRPSERPRRGRAVNELVWTLLPLLLLLILAWRAWRFPAGW